MIVITIQLLGLSQEFPVLRADFSPEAVVTEHPVEFGAEVTDHVQQRPLRFSVDTLVTESPLLAPVPGALELAEQFFEQAMGQLLTVTIPGKGTYINCVLEAYPSSITNRRARAFTLRFRQVRIASAVSVAIPARTPAPVAAAGAPTEAPLGQQAAAPVPETSALFDLRALLSPFH